MRVVPLAALVAQAQTRAPSLHLPLAPHPGNAAQSLCHLPPQGAHSVGCHHHPWMVSAGCARFPRQVFSLTVYSAHFYRISLRKTPLSAAARVGTPLCLLTGLSRSRSDAAGALRPAGEPCACSPFSLPAGGPRPLLPRRAGFPASVPPLRIITPFPPLSPLCISPHFLPLLGDLP